MKNMLLAFIASLCGLVIILIGFTLYGRSIRQIELDNALKFSMEEAMTSLMYEEGGPENEEEWKAAFIQSFVIQISSVSDIKITFLEVNMEMGILSVEGMLTWRHPIGTVGKVSNKMTVIL